MIHRHESRLGHLDAPPEMATVVAMSNRPPASEPPALSTGPCPRCGQPLARAGDGTGLSCSSCRGSFAFRASIDAVLAAAASIGPVVSYRESARASTASSSKGAFEPGFRYLACPLCGEKMTRQNFMRRSGVIVDTCLHHGTWFDAAEALRVAEFIAGGGKRPADDEPSGAPREPRMGAVEGLLALLRQ